MTPPSPPSAGIEPASDLRARARAGLACARGRAGAARAGAGGRAGAGRLGPGSLGARSPAGVEDRLRELSNRFRGARAVAVRREPVPAAYRVFFRHIGLDPDVVRTPIEAVALERMLRGGFLSGGLLEDSPADRAGGHGRAGVGARRRGRRRSARHPHERRGRAPGTVPARRRAPLPAGRLVVADASAALAVLFGELAAGRTRRRRTRPR